MHTKKQLLDEKQVKLQCKRALETMSMYLDGKEYEAPAARCASKLSGWEVVQRARQNQARGEARSGGCRKSGYYSVENQFERFRVFLELTGRFEFEFRRRENYTHHVAVHVHVLWPVCTHTIPIRTLSRP